MADQSARGLFDRWERVWHNHEYALVESCLHPVYVRHEEAGTRRVTPGEYAAELQAAHQARPDTRIVVYDHEIVAGRAWFRFNFVWRDATSGERRSRAGMQAYRIERGRLAETWLSLLGPGSAWPDVGRQERWTSKAGDD